MRTRQCETIYLGIWIRPALAVFRPQEGSGEECGRVSEFFLQNFGGGNIKESEYFPQLYSNC